MSFVGLCGLSMVAAASEATYRVAHELSQNKTVCLGNENARWTIFPDHTMIQESGGRMYYLDHLAVPIIGVSVAAIAGTYIAYKSFKSAYNSLKSIGQ